ncbi:MAG TPA: hypothetical protein VLI05_03400 [Candidatus Saccharimonadia bacterium]|nr:hypothetical protein [Candidatus Saccharimonadia bacterium]
MVTASPKSSWPKAGPSPLLMHPDVWKALQATTTDLFGLTPAGGRLLQQKLGVTNLAELLLRPARNYPAKLLGQASVVQLQALLRQHQLRLPTHDELESCRDSFWVELGLPDHRFRVRAQDVAQLPLERVIFPSTDGQRQTEAAAALWPILELIPTVERLDMPMPRVFKWWQYEYLGPKPKEAKAVTSTAAVIEAAARQTLQLQRLVELSGLAGLGYELRRPSKA